MKCANCITSKTLKRSVGVCAFVFFTTLAIFWGTLFDAIMKTQIQLKPGSVLHKMWMKNPIPIYVEIYLFNFTNAKEFEQNKSVVPNFGEIGPFYFEETREKVNVSWNQSEDTVEFNQSKTWHFLPEISEDFSIEVTNINPIAATIAYISRLWESKLQREIANTLLNIHEPLIVTGTAREWIFDGIPDPFLDIFEALRKVTDIPIPYNRFGWFYNRNGSSIFDGVFTVKTGRSNLDDLGMMTAWNHLNKTDHYVDECASVRGTTGEVLPPLKPFQESLTVFATDICSYITLKFSKSVDYGGLTAYEYVGDESVFDNGTRHPENVCFYTGESCPSGSRNVSSCRFNSPAFISFPHFYLADSYFTKRISGMNPDESKHKFSLKVEPTTGIPLAVEASFQINFFVESYSWCDEFREMPKIHIPMLWFKQTVEMPANYLVTLEVLLFIQAYGRYFILGFVLFALLGYCYFKRDAYLRRKND